MSRIDIVKIGITELETDAIVNAANNKLSEGSGVCGAIFAAAGREEMTKACREIGGCITGMAVLTPGFALKAKYVIHTVGPVYSEKAENGLMDGAMYSCYKESLDLAKVHGCHSIGFPLISTGVFGYPKDKAWDIALRACGEWILANPDYPMDVVFAVLDDDTLKMGEETMARLAENE